MRYMILTAAALALGAAPALAATGVNTPAGPNMAPSGITGQSSSESGSSAAMQDQGNMPSPEIQQKITHELSQAGFTDIHVMPQSFLVHAKDSAGNPVYMAITPHSLTALTLNRHGGQSAANSTGSAIGTNGSSGSWGANGSSSSGAMGTSTMQHSAQAGSAINSPNGNGTTVH